jgi:hypothetical protein
MIKLMELTEKYICKSSLPDIATTASTGLVAGTNFALINACKTCVMCVCFTAPPAADNWCAKDFEPKSGNKKMVFCIIAANQ